jgi:integrase
LEVRKNTCQRLTDRIVRVASPKEQDYWLNDGAALRLLVKSNGTKCWRFNYRFAGKQKTLAIGTYPTISLKQAREKLLEAKSNIKEGIDPSFKKKQDRLINVGQEELIFKNIAFEWWEHQSGTWTTDHAQRVWTRLEQNTKLIFNRVITKITPLEVIQVVREIEKRDALDVAGRVLQDIRRVCRYAVQTGRILHNPASELSDIRKTRKTQHRASLPREELPEFLQALEDYKKQGRLLTQYAIKLLVLTFLRPGELRGGRWEEIDFNENLWRIPAERMKMGTEHLVPLPRQALDLLKKIKIISGKYPLIFPSEQKRTQCMSDNTMRRAIFKLGYDGKTPGKSKCVPHGFRATASSILNEHGFNPDAIERQLSHQERNGVRAAYLHHARFLEERRKMMQWWADYLDGMRESGKVVPIFSTSGTV